MQCRVRPFASRWLPRPASRLTLAAAWLFAALLSAASALATEALDDNLTDDSRAGERGPLEFAAAGVPGNLAAPGSATAETRFGASLRFLNFLTAGEYGGTFDEQLLLILEAHLALPLGFEAGVDVDGLYWHDTGIGDAAYDNSPPPSLGFGFVVLRGKKEIYSTDVLGLAVGVGFLLPTARSEAPEPAWRADERRTYFAADPGFYLAYRPASWVSFNLSLPFLFAWQDSSSSGSRGDYVIAPAIGIATLWADTFGLVLDMQVPLRLDPSRALDQEQAVANFQAMFGIRVNVAGWFLAEVGGIFGLENFAGGLDLGGGAVVRLAATPKLF